MSLTELIPDADYRFHFRFERGNIKDFFGRTAHHSSLIAERQKWLRRAPDTYTRVLPEGQPLVRETSELAREWIASGPEDNEREITSDTDEVSCLELGARWEPDFLLLKADSQGQIRLWAGCVCFPSSWSLADKIGLPIESIHGVVPGLNGQIGSQIHQFLSRLKPGVAWLRSNWGFSRSRELNQHPDRDLPCLDASIKASEVSFRVEHQALLALPRSGGILFGIRIAMHSMQNLQAEPLVVARLVRALTTMPEAMAHYKGLATVRQRLIELLEQTGATVPPPK